MCSEIGEFVFGCLWKSFSILCRVAFERSKRIFRPRKLRFFLDDSKIFERNLKSQKENWAYYSVLLKYQNDNNLGKSEKSNPKSWQLFERKDVQEKRTVNRIPFLKSDGIRISVQDYF